MNDDAVLVDEPQLLERGREPGRLSGSRSDFPWQNTIRVEGELREAIPALKTKIERGVLVGTFAFPALRDRSSC